MLLVLPHCPHHARQGRQQTAINRYQIPQQGQVSLAQRGIALRCLRPGPQRQLTNHVLEQRRVKDRRRLTE